MTTGGGSSSDDFDWLIDNFMIEVFGSNAGLDGDYNEDGKVDAADYVVWRKTDGTPAGYNLWAANFGAMAGSGGGSNVAGSVPEPASAVLLAIAGVLPFCWRRRDRLARLSVELTT
jgi:MprA protease rhombosortase-interaction domain-containing protein